MEDKEEIVQGFFGDVQKTKMHLLKDYFAASSGVDLVVVFAFFTAAWDVWSSFHWCDKNRREGKPDDNNEGFTDWSNSMETRMAFVAEIHRFLMSTTSGGNVNIIHISKPS